MPRYRFPLNVHFLVAAIASLNGFDLMIAIRDVDLIYPEVCRPRAQA